MSNFPGERRTSKGPTEEMGGEEALGKTGEKNSRMGTLRTRKKTLLRGGQ